jgi:GT2 family glycosyltransferase
MNRPLAAIINSFNRVDLLKTALPSLIRSLKNVSVGSSIVIFDAGSTDGSVKYIEDMQEKSELPIHLVEPSEDEDSSFSAGVNRGVAHAAACYPELEWCFLYETDNDLKNPDALEEGLALLRRREELGAVGFTVEKQDGEKTEFGKPFPSVWSFVLGQHLTSELGLSKPDVRWQADQGQRFSYCEVVHTSPLLVDYGLWKEINGMDTETFPFTDSDVDLCWRIVKYGKKCGVLNVDGVVHDNRQQQSDWSKGRVLHFHKGRYKVLRKHRGERASAIRPLLLIRHFVEWFGLLFLWTVGKRPASALDTRIQLMKLSLFGYE